MRTASLLTIAILLGLLAVSCGQDNLFERITYETVPTRPRVEGAPTNMVVVTRSSVPIMYVASGRLHWYATADDPEYPGDASKKRAQWDVESLAIPQPAGKIMSLAQVSNTLYALCREESGTNLNMTVRSIGPSDNVWKDIPFAGSGKIEVIYADGRLFAGAHTGADGKTFAILAMNAAGTLEVLQADTAMLKGVAASGTTYYLATMGKGIYTVTGTNMTATPLMNKEDRKFISIINVNGTIIAMERGEPNGGGSRGQPYTVTASGFSPTQQPGGGDAPAAGFHATGALGLWTDGTDNLLILGIQQTLTTATSNRYGYVEYKLNGSAIEQLNVNNLMSIEGAQNQYESSLAKYPVNHLLQTPGGVDSAQTFFVSTQTKGLWSFRQRGGVWQWNAEE